MTNPAKRANIQHGLEDFEASAASGDLPAVSFLKPGDDDGNPAYSTLAAFEQFERNWGLGPLSARSLDRLPDPISRRWSPYEPTNGSAIDDMFDYFDFRDARAAGAAPRLARGDRNGTRWRVPPISCGERLLSRSPSAMSSADAGRRRR